MSYLTFFELRLSAMPIDSTRKAALWMNAKVKKYGGMCL